MSLQYLGEIRIMAFNFAPKGWAMCNGQILSIQQNTALFSLLGTTYGGNGKSTFGLPNLMSAIPLHVGRSQPGPGLSVYDLGELGGTPNVTLLQTEMAAHSHSPVVTTVDGTVTTAANNQPARAYVGNLQDFTEGLFYSPVPTPQIQFPPQTLGLTGGSAPHNNMMPYLTLYFNIALQGVFPPRT